MKRTVVLAAATLLVAGCSSGPSSGAMQKGLLSWMHDNADKSAEIQEFKNGDFAKSDSQPGYACSVHAKVSYMQGAQNDTMQGTFIFDKVDGDWTVVGRIN